MSGTLYEVFSKVMRALVGKKITVPGPFKKCASHLMHVHVFWFAYMHASIYMFFLSLPFPYVIFWLPPSSPLFLSVLPDSVLLTSHNSSNDQCAIACSNRATSGYLYPLDKGFIFVHRPAVYIKFDAIASVNFARVSGSAGISRSFDFELEMKDGNVIHFSSIIK